MSSRLRIKVPICVLIDFFQYFLVWIHPMKVIIHNNYFSFQNDCNWLYFLVFFWTKLYFLVLKYFSDISLQPNIMKILFERDWYNMIRENFQKLCSFLLMGSSGILTHNYVLWSKHPVLFPFLVGISYILWVFFGASNSYSILGNQTGIEQPK